MVRYRRRIEIVADVLGVIRGGARKTDIMYQANLSYKLLIRYLNDVMNMGLVRRAQNGNIYELTKKGVDFLREFKEYYERFLEVRKKLGDIQNKKRILENRFLNSGVMSAHSGNCPSKKVGIKKKT